MITRTAHITEPQIRSAGPNSCTATPTEAESHWDHFLAKEMWNSWDLTNKNDGFSMGVYGRHEGKTSPSLQGVPKLRGGRWGQGQLSWLMFIAEKSSSVALKKKKKNNQSPCQKGSSNKMMPTKWSPCIWNKNVGCRFSMVKSLQGWNGCHGRPGGLYE